MTYEEIKQNFQKDYKIYMDDLINEPNNSAMRHIKYIDLYLKYKDELNNLFDKQKKLKNDLTEYYSGQASNEVYKQKPFSLKLRKPQIQSYVEADDEYLKLNQEIKEVEKILNLLETVVDRFKWRDKAIGIMLDYEKFLNAR